MADHTTSWLTLAGTALSGLGTTLNGLNSLYGLTSQMQHFTSSAEAAVPAITGSVVSGTVALTSGWLTAAKISSAGAGLSLSTVGLGAGCLYASVGFLWFIYSISRLNTDVPPIHAPVKGSKEFAQFPEPEWLSTRVLNWGVMGRVGVGKSTLINSLRGLRAKSPDAAPVGVGHTTRRPHPYNFAGDIALLTRNMARLWDLPGAGTKDWPGASYIRDAGLRHFDGVVFVTAGAFSEAEVDLMNQLMGFKVPYYVVRNKVDQDALNNKQDNDVDVEGTLREIRDELTEHGCDPGRTFLISAKHPECPDFDFARLLRAMAADAAQQRCELPEFHGDRPRTATRLVRRALSAPRPPSQGGVGGCGSGCAAAATAPGAAEAPACAGRRGDEEESWTPQRRPSPQRQLQQLQQLQQLHQQHGQQQGQQQEQQLLLQRQHELHLQQNHLRRQQQHLQLQDLQPPQPPQPWTLGAGMESASSTGHRHAAPSCSSSSRARPPSAPPPQLQQRMQSVPELSLHGAPEASLMRAVSFSLPAAAAGESQAATTMPGLPPLPPLPLQPRYGEGGGGGGGGGGGVAGCGGGGGGDGQYDGHSLEESVWSLPSPRFLGERSDSSRQAAWTF